MQGIERASHNSYTRRLYSTGDRLAFAILIAIVAKLDVIAPPRTTATLKCARYRLQSGENACKLTNYMFLTLI